jgi:putative phosphoesterase
MKIALIADIHANLPALDAVLDHANQEDVDAIWNMGDSVGYGPFPDEVIQRLQQQNIISILGNYDRKVLQFPKKATKWRANKKQEKYFAFEWAYEQLTPISRKYLRSLPQEIRLDVLGWKILLTHGSPASQDEHLLPTTPEPHLAELAKIAHVDMIICGHSHRSFTRKVEQTWFINPGSVGRPDDGDPRASYAVMILDAEQNAVIHHRIAYDIQASVRAIEKYGLPADFGRMLIEGVSLDELHFRNSGRPASDHIL